MKPNYASALRASESQPFKLDDVLAPDADLDFERPFMPEALAGTAALSFLAPAERLVLNQIRAHGYLCSFGLVEEFILPFVLERLQARAEADMDEVRALLAFAGEEAKHIALFRRFREVFVRGFGHHCGVIGPPSDIRRHVLSHSPLGVGLLILHIEWMTQQHYVEMVRDDSAGGALEPCFRRLLHEHWVEECQHARIDGWIVESVAEAASPAARARAFDDYVGLLEFLDQGLVQQVELDLRAFQQAAGRALSPAQQAEFRAVQHQSQRATYLGAGVSHPKVRAIIGRIHPESAEPLASLSARYRAA